MTQLQTEIVGGESYEYLPLGEYVVRALGVCGGRPTFKYTRIEITGVLLRLGSGESLESIVEGFQGRVSAEAICEAGIIVTLAFLNDLPVLEASQ